MLKVYTKRTYVCWLLSGLLFGLSFVNTYSGVLVFPAFWLFYEAVKNTHSYHKLFGGIFLVGVLKYMGGVGWFWYSFPIDSLPFITPSAQVFFIFMYWIIAGVLLSTGFTVVIFLSRFLVKNFKWWLLILPVVWILAEAAGSAVFSLGTLGEGSYLNVNFSFGYVGYLLADIPMLVAFAKFGGVYTLTFLLTAVAVLTYAFWKKIFHSYVTIALALALVVLLIVTNVYTEAGNKEGLRILSVDTVFDGSSTNTKKKQLKNEIIFKEAVTEALKQDVDIVLLPEDSRFTRMFPSPEYALRYVQDQNEGSEVTLVDSSYAIDERGKIILRAYIYDTKTKTVSWVDKKYLVPQGEYIPYIFKAMIKKLFSEDKTSEIFYSYNFQPGLIVDYNNVPAHIPPILFCMESVSPVGVKNIFSAKRPDYVLHIISHSWFHNPSIMHLNLERMLKTQAVWNGVTIVEASNMKDSQRLWADGQTDPGRVLETSDRWTLRLFE